MRTYFGPSLSRLFQPRESFAGWSRCSQPPLNVPVPEELIPPGSHMSGVRLWLISHGCHCGSEARTPLAATFPVASIAEFQLLEQLRLFCVGGRALGVHRAVAGVVMQSCRSPFLSDDECGLSLPGSGTFRSLTLGTCAGLAGTGGGGCALTLGSSLVRRERIHATAVGWFAFF